MNRNEHLDHRPISWTLGFFRRDEVRYDEQGNVVSALPKATYKPGVQVSSNYVPVVQEIDVGAAGQPCQSLKSEDAVKAAFPKAKPAADPQRICGSAEFEKMGDRMP